MLLLFRLSNQLQQLPFMWEGLVQVMNHIEGKCFGAGYFQDRTYNPLVRMSVRLQADAKALSVIYQYSFWIIGFRLLLTQFISFSGVMH